MRTRNGEGVRTQHGWAWICGLCHQVSNMGVGKDVVLFVPYLLQAMDDAHWCALKGRDHG